MQRKWYPGEPIPRWQTTIFGEKTKNLFGKIQTISKQKNKFDYTTADAKNFFQLLL